MAGCNCPYGAPRASTPLYMEANGILSLVEAEGLQPGLLLVLGWDAEFRQVQPAAPGAFACR